MKKTYVTTVPNHIGAFLSASRLLAAMADASYAKSVFHIERYTLSVGAKANHIINTCDDAQRAETDPAARAALREKANADLAEAQSALEQAQTALDADSENADLLAARDAAQARVDELNQTIAEKQAILDAAPAETPAPEAPAEEEQPAE